MNTRCTSARLAAAGALLAALLSVSAAPQAAEARKFDVVALPLAAALAEFSSQSGIRTAYATELVNGKTSRRVEGYLAPEQALAALLAGTGLRYEFLTDDTVRIEPVPAAERPAAFPSIVVRDDTPETTQAYAARAASTATKTDTPILQTPMKVDVVTQQILKDKGLTGVSGLGDALLSFGISNLGQGNLGEQLFYRGFPSTTTLWNGFRIEDLGTNVNGINGGVWLDNVERLEILRGPSSILYGRAEPGGAVNVITKRPQENFGAEVEAGIGSRSDRWLAGDLTGSLNAQKTLRYRLNVSHEGSDSWYRYGPANRSTGVAPSLEWQITNQTRVSLEGQYRRLRGSSSQPYIPVNVATQTLFAVDPKDTLAPGAQAEFKQNRTAVSVEHRFNEHWTVTWKYLYNDVKSPLTVLPLVVGMRYTGPDNSVPIATRGIIVNRGDQQAHATSLDLVGKLDTGSLKHTLLFGADYYDTKTYQNTNFGPWSNEYEYFNPTPYPNADEGIPGPSDRYTLDQKELSLYVQDQVELPHNVHVLVGGRYQKIKERSLYVVPPIPDFNFPGFVEDIPYKKNIFLPRAGVLWQPQPNLSLYYSYAENAGASQGLEYPGRPIKPEASRQHEVGIKSEWRDGRLTAALALFDLTKSNIVGADPGHPGFNIGVGRVRSKGFELSLQGALTDDWNIQTSWNHARPFVEEGSGGATSSQAPFIEKGMHLPYFSEHSFSILTSYRLPFAPLRGLRVGGGFSRFSAATMDSSSIIRTRPYGVWSFFSAYDAQIGGYGTTLQLNVDNAFDKHYLTYQGDIGAIDGLSDVNFVGGNWGAPRQVRVAVRVAF